MRLKLLAAAAAVVIGVGGTLVWQWRASVDEAATMRQQATELRQALRESESQASAARERIVALSAAVEAQRRRAKAAQLSRAEAQQRLRQLESNNEQVREWSDNRIPDDVRGWLRGDESADGQD